MPINIPGRDEYEKISQGNLRKRQYDAMMWFRDKLNLTKSTTRIRAEDLINKKRNVNEPLVGQLILFQYDAKHKDKLPYWDVFPLSMIIDIQEDGFLSLNLHYLDYNYRYLLIRRLLETISDNKLDWRSKARINYGLVKSFAKFQIAQPCIKKHLFSQIRSKIVRIQPVEWINATYIPMDLFVGASKQKVWADSRRMIGRRR